MSKAYLFEQSIRKTKIATEKDFKRAGIETGEQISYIPPPKNKAEIFERFKKLQAQQMFEAHLRVFKSKYGNASKKVIEDELSTLNNFISDANKLSTTETFKNKHQSYNYQRDLHEYSRLVNGYYENSNKPFTEYGYYNGGADLVYAKYVMYKEWLESEIKRLDSLGIIAQSNKKVSKLFEFIDFLDFKKYDFKLLCLTVLDELNLLNQERNQLKPNENFKDREQQKTIQNQIAEKFDFLKREAIEPIKKQLKDLGIWQGDDEATSIYNGAISAIEQLKREFESQHIPIIQNYKEKYASYRTEVNTDFYSLTFQFNELDEVLNNLFSYFNEVSTNFLEPFEKKSVLVDSIPEMIEHFKQGNKDVIFQMPNGGKKEWTLEDYLNHYLTTKRIGFELMLKAYKPKEFAKVDERLNDYLKRYKYIFDHVENKQRIELKSDAIDSLKKIIEYQEHTKFKELIKFVLLELEQYPETLDAKKQKDDRILLIDLQNHILNDDVSHEYETYIKHFKREPYFVVNFQKRKYKVYSAGLSYLFSVKNINAKNLDNIEKVELDTHSYFKTFAEAFEQGKKYLNDNYRVSKDILYSVNASKLVSDIHDKYHHKQWASNSNMFGWKAVKGSDPMLITHKLIFDYGYYSGVLSEADTFISDYPTVFKDVHKCSAEQPNDVEEKNEPFSFKNNFDSTEPDAVYAHFKKGLVESKMLPEKELQLYLLSAFQNNTDPKQRFKIKGTTNNKVMAVFYTYYKDIAGKPHGKQKQYAGLLGNYFQGYKTSTVSSNFSKSVY